jgi:uncharacterized membrane protein affecting hemolysin expression
MEKIMKDKIKKTWDNSKGPLFLIFLVGLVLFAMIYPIV